MKRILFFLLLFSATAFAQTKEKSFYTIYINYPDYTIKADVLAEKKELKFKENLTYYWYSSNKIFETKGGGDGKILNGNFSSYYLSGNLKEKGNFKNGLKNGEWISWFESGKINEVINWHKGVKDGLYKKFDTKGDLILESSYKKGELNGNQISYDKGKVVSKKMFKNGLEAITKTNPDEKEKKTLKEKIKSVFKKKDNTKTEKVKDSDKKNNTTVTPKKTFKERIKSFFKGKNKTEKTPEKNK